MTGKARGWSRSHESARIYNPCMSKPPRTRFRSLDGILLLDKPRGLSSNQALQRVRHLFRARKAGHTGSLDPLATGLLPVCFGEATKIAGGLLGARKARSEEHTSALQSLMRISYAVFCLKKKKQSHR